MEYIIIFWMCYTLTAIIAGFIGAYLCKKFFLIEQPGKESQQNPAEAISSALNPDNLGTQLYHALLLICLIYIPLDMLSYLIPGVFDYEATAILSNPLGQYLVWSLTIMLFTTIISHFCVALREEWYFRAYCTTIGERSVSKSTIFLYSAFLFGLAHFSYIFSSDLHGLPVYFPIWWGMNALFIGIVAGYYFLEKRNLWPLIISHWINNVVSAIVLRNYLFGIPFIQSVYYLYAPFLIIGIILLIVKRPKVGYHVRKIWKYITSYFQDLKTEGNAAITLILDIALVILIWLISLVTF